MRPDCKCHGEPMYRNSGSVGGWRCSVADRLRGRRSYSKVGWATKRRRDLAAQREGILTALADLAGQEMEVLRESH